MQQKALVDLDQLISQHNLRQVYDDKLSFIAAAALYPDRQEQLKKILDQMQVIETAIIQAGEIEKRGDFADALRTAEKLEEKGEIGSSLAWYLKARKLYPASGFAQAGIDRLVKEVSPGKSRDSFEQRLGRGARAESSTPRQRLSSRAAQTARDLPSVVRRELA